MTADLTPLVSPTDIHDHLEADPHKDDHEDDEDGNEQIQILFHDLFLLVRTVPLIKFLDTVFNLYLVGPAETVEL